MADTTQSLLDSSFAPRLVFRSSTRLSLLNSLPLASLVASLVAESGAYLKKIQDLLTSTLLSASNTLESLSLAIQDSLNVASRSGYQLKSSSSYTNVTLPSDYVSAFLTPLMSSIKSPSTFSALTSPRLISSASSGGSKGGERKRDILKAAENVRGTKIYEER